MGLPFFSKQSSNESNKFLTLEINSRDVKCVLVYFENGKFKIIGSGKQTLENSSVRAGNIIDLDNTLDAVNLAVTKACENSGDGVNNVIFGVSGDLSLGLTTTVRVRRSKKDPINNKEINELNNKINEAAYMQALNEYLQTTGNSDIDLEIITSSTVYTKADNDYVESLEKHTAEYIETAVFNAFTPSYHIDTLKKIAKSSGLNILAIGSGLYTYVQSLKNTEFEHTDFILIDVSDDSTNVAIVFGGGIVATKSMSIGYRHFVETIAEKMGLTVVEAEKMLRAYISNGLTQSEMTIVQTCIQEVIEVWIEGLQILFAEFSGVKTFSHKVYLTGVGTDISDVINAVSNEPWTKSIPFKSVPEFKKLTFMDFSDISDSTGKTNSEEWLNTVLLGEIFKEMYQG